MEEARLSELKKQYGEVIVVRSKNLGVEVVFRPARRKDVARFVDLMVDNKYKAMYTLVLDCAVHPDREQLSVLFDKHPMAPMELANHLLSDAGMGEVLVKKL